MLGPMLRPRTSQPTSPTSSTASTIYIRDPDDSGSSFTALCAFVAPHAALVHCLHSHVLAAGPTTSTACSRRGCAFEHFSLISEYSLSDNSRNSVLPAHSFAESVLLMRLACCVALPLLSTAIHNYNVTRPTASSTRLNNHVFDATRYDGLNMMLTSLKELLNWVVELHLHPAPHLAHHQPSRPLYMWAHLPRCESRQQHFKLQQL